MALNIKNATVEQLVIEIAAITKETKTETIRKALEERKQRLALQSFLNVESSCLSFLETEVWPTVPKEELGRRLSKEQEEEILGLGSMGA